MAKVDVHGWLGDWVSDWLNTPQYYEDKGVMASDAAACRYAAKAAGISDDDLNDAVGGDLQGFLLDQQNSYTDAEVRRRAAEDD